MNFVDLAGSERGHDSIYHNRCIYRENREINKSLLVLKECIRSLNKNSKHIPFRRSKLTSVLRESFTNKCKTLMISNISPSNAAYSDTMNTLHYSSNVKNLKKIIKLDPIKKHYDESSSSDNDSVNIVNKK